MGDDPEIEKKKKMPTKCNFYLGGKIKSYQKIKEKMGKKSD